MDIVTPSLDQVLPKVDSRYTLVSLAAKRARDIMDGSHAVSNVFVDNGQLVVGSSVDTEEEQRRRHSLTVE